MIKSDICDKVSLGVYFFFGMRSGLFLFLKNIYLAVLGLSCGMQAPDGVGFSSCNAQTELF